MKSFKTATFFLAAMLASGWAMALPSGTDKTLTTVEETAITLTVADFGYSDPGANALASVFFSPQPTSGILTDNGASVTSSTPVPASDIAAGLLKWTPALNSAGNAASLISFSVINSIGEQDPTPNVITMNVSAVNDAPLIGSDLVTNGNFASGLAFWTFTGSVDLSYGGLAFNTGETPANGKAWQSIATVASSTYVVNFTTVSGGYATAGQQLRISAVDVASSAVLATTTIGQNLSGSLNFTATGSSTRLLIEDISTIISATDIALTGISARRSDSTNSTYEDHPFVWSSGNENAIVVSDVDGTTGTYTLTLSVSHGTLTLATTAGLTISAGSNGSASMTISGTQAAINTALNGLTFNPTANYNGSDTLSLLLNDNGNTGTGGALTASKSVPLTILPVNDPPAGTDKTVTVNEDTTYTFAAADFGFTEPLDTPPNVLSSVTITTLPASGVLALSGTPVTAGQVVPAASIGSLTWAPVANSNGVTLASFTFQVQDDGGTANGGIDLDSSPNTITFNVTPVNDPPVAVDDSYLTGQDTPVTLSLVANDTDIDGDTLQVASINGTAVTPGTAQTIVVPHGTVKISAAGVLSFVPDAGYVGTASFDYVVSDGHGGTDTGTVSVTVLAITPVPAGDTVSYVLLALLLGVFARGALQAKRLQRRRS